MSASKTIGVVGLGSIGMRHAKNLLAMGHEVWTYDPDESKKIDGVEYMANPLTDGGSGYNTIRLMDAVVIASPTAEHDNYLSCAVIHKRPTLIEKPISDRLDTAAEIMADAKAPVMVGNNLRFHSCVKKVKEWLSEGLIGKPLWASFCVAQHNTKYTDPVVLNWGAHEFDLALYLLGPATVTAAVGNDKIMDVCLLHEYGVPSTIHCDYVTRPERRWFSIVCEKGIIHADLVSRVVKFEEADGGKGAIVCDDSFDQNYKDEMQAFIDLIDGKPHPEAATGQDGLACLELILEAKRMAEK